MSSTLALIIAITLAAFTICHALPDLHKRMTPHQLQSVFHVDTHAAVPQYEVIQLLHHTSSSDHNRRRRSIERAPLQSLHHVKKDLSKNAYYSELKQAASSLSSSSNHLDVANIKTHNVSFSAFGQHMNLSLRATQGLFKGTPNELRMWTVGSDVNATHGLDLQEIEEKHNSEDIGDVFQDEENMAAILMRRQAETGDLIMEGSIGHDMVIKPLPHNLSPSPTDAHHVVFKRSADTVDEQLSDFAFMEPDDLLASENLERLQKRQKRAAASEQQRSSFKDFDDDEDEGALEEEAVEPQQSESRTRLRRQAPYIIYPEVLVIVDYDGYRLHGGDNLQVKRYFISFWNGVDLRYRLLKGPRIRISIAGIIISRGRDATPYLERNRVGRDAIDSAAALTDMGKYLFRERRLPVYDIAVAITKLDMCRRTSAYGECNRGTAGFAYVGGACVVNKRLEKVNSVAIIEDTGGFSGIIVAAHEVGHLLGAVHDGSPPPSYLGGPGAQRCRWEDGYIMSDLRHTERGFRWSACTVQSFHHFLNGDTATCLHNAPHEDSALGRSLPGTLLSLDAQCRRDRGTYACFKDERVCAQLFCFDAQTGYCVAYRPAAEGSACGNGYHCLDGRCTPLHSNIIPDYGNNYRLVYNKNNKTDATREQQSQDIENSSEETDSSEDENANDDHEDGDEEAEAEEEVANENNNNNNEGLSSNEDQEQDNQIDQSSLPGVADANAFTSSGVTTRTTTSTSTTTMTTTHRPKTTRHNYSKSFEYLRRLWPQTTATDDNSLTLYNTGVPTPTTTLGTTQNGGSVVVETRTSSSISSSGTNNTANRNSYTNTTPKTVTTTTATTTTTPHSNIFQIYTHEFRKQIEYYLHMLQQQQLQQKQKQTHVTPTEHLSIPLIQKQARTKLIPNYSATNNNSNHKNNEEHGEINNNNNQNHNSNNGKEGNKRDDVYGENDANAGIESNEAIERQKRKFLIQQQQPQPQQQQQQQQQQQLSSSSPPQLRQYLQQQQQQTDISSTVGTTVTTAKPITSTMSFLDAYFKKLQSMHLPTLNGGSAVTATTTTSTTTTSVSKSVSSTTSATSNSNNSNNNKQQQHQAPTNFDANAFLKRTLNSKHNLRNINSKNGSGSSSTTNSSSNISGISSSNLNDQTNTEQQQQQQQLQLQQRKERIEQQWLQTSPAYVTNYLGDNTNNLPTVLANDQKSTATTATTTSTATASATTTLLRQSNDSSTATTIPKKQKIKTQKLIRRTRIL